MPQPGRPLVSPSLCLNPTNDTHSVSNPEVGNSRPKLLNGTSSAHPKCERIALNKELVVQPVQIERIQAGVIDFDEDLAPSGLREGCLCNAQLAGGDSANEVVSRHGLSGVLSMSGEG